jgi:hypothetical protein
LLKNSGARVGRRGMNGRQYEWGVTEWPREPCVPSQSSVVLSAGWYRTLTLETATSILSSTREQALLILISERQQSDLWVSRSSSPWEKAPANRLKPTPTASEMASSPLKLGLSWGSWLQQCCINFFNSSKPGVSGLDGGTSSNEGRFCLSHTASQTIDVWITTGVGWGGDKKRDQGIRGYLLYYGQEQGVCPRGEVRRKRRTWGFEEEGTWVQSLPRVLHSASLPASTVHMRIPKLQETQGGGLANHWQETSPLERPGEV